MNKTIVTKYGTFNIESAFDGKGSMIVNNSGGCLMPFPKTPWWDLDGLERKIAENIDILNARLKESSLEVSRKNAAEVLQRLVGVLGGEEKGFYASRLKQCLNKLNAA
jgi:hypothetical protein